jgi:hypothetical protein
MQNQVVSTTSDNNKAIVAGQNSMPEVVLLGEFVNNKRIIEVGDVIYNPNAAGNNIKALAAVRYEDGEVGLVQLHQCGVSAISHGPLYWSVKCQTVLPQLKIHSHNTQKSMVVIVGGYVLSINDDIHLLLGSWQSCCMNDIF